MPFDINVMNDITMGREREGGEGKRKREENVSIEMNRSARTRFLHISMVSRNV